MHKEQKILFIADKPSLINAYNIAKLVNVNSTSTPAVINVAKLIVTNSMIDTIATARTAASFFSKGKVSTPKISNEVMLTAIQQSLGLGATVSYVPLNEANNVALGMGEVPRNNCFYISHPIKDDIYIPLQDYNKLLAKEKSNVFMELAAALGAKSIYLEDASFYNTKGQIETDFSVLKPAAMDIGINAKFEKDGSIKKEVYSSFDKPRRAPTVPIHLQTWVDIDSDLSLMATHRLNNGLRSHQISLTFDDSLNGAAETTAIITSINKGVSLKASASRNISSTWVFKVEYHSMEDE